MVPDAPSIDAAKLRKNASYREVDPGYGVHEIPGLETCLPRDSNARFSILEIGCANGHSSALVKKRYPHARVVAGDIVDECLARVREHYPDVETVRLDADGGFPLADASFEYVFSSNLFEHLHDDAAHLREVARILRPGGTYVVSTPNLLVELLYWGLLRPELETRWRSIWARLSHDRRTQHSNLQTVGSLQRRLRRAGLVPVVQPRANLSSLERTKLEGLMRFVPPPGRERLVDAVDRLWCRLPAALGPTLVVAGRKPDQANARPEAS